LDYDIAFNLISSILAAVKPPNPRKVLEDSTLEVARLLKKQLAQEANP